MGHVQVREHASSGDYSFTANTTEPTRTYRVHANASGGNPSVDSDPLTVTTVTPPPGEVGPTGPVKGSLTESPTTYSRRRHDLAQGELPERLVHDHPVQGGSG